MRLLIPLACFAIAAGVIWIFRVTEKLTETHPRRGTPGYDWHIQSCEVCYFAERERQARAAKLTKMNQRARRENFR
jgi:hypothetical protein